MSINLELKYILCCGQVVINRNTNLMDVKSVFSATKERNLQEIVLVAAFGLEKSGAYMMRFLLLSPDQKVIRETAFTAMNIVNEPDSCTFIDIIKDIELPSTGKYSCILEVKSANDETVQTPSVELFKYRN